MSDYKHLRETIDDLLRSKRYDWLFIVKVFSPLVILVLIGLGWWLIFG